MVGELADSEADQLLRIIPAVQPIKPSLITPEGQDQETESSGGRAEDGEDQYLQRALAESRQLVEQDDSALQQALRDSMEGNSEYRLQRGDVAQWLREWGGEGGFKPQDPGFDPHGRIRGSNSFSAPPPPLPL